MNHITTIRLSKATRDRLKLPGTKGTDENIVSRLLNEKEDAMQRAMPASAMGNGDNLSIENQEAVALTDFALYPLGVASISKENSKVRT